jgi:TetR/AcrR family transcriptional repressor of nem operon
MGHSKASKALTHSRLVEAAAARFKERGVDGISLADLMRDLKLTHGGFYRHFDSRDALVAEALESALDESGQTLRERLLDGDEPDVAGFLDFYLNEAHRDARSSGCAVAALAGDAARKGPDVQAQFRRQIERNVGIMSEALNRSGAKEPRESALLLLSTLYGALTMARAVGDSPLSREVLQTVRKRATAAATAAAAGIGKKKRTRVKAKK